MHATEKKETNISNKRHLKFPTGRRQTSQDYRETNPASGRVEALNPGPPDYNTSALNHSASLLPWKQVLKNLDFRRLLPRMVTQLNSGSFEAFCVQRIVCGGVKRSGYFLSYLYEFRQIQTIKCLIITWPKRSVCVATPTSASSCMSN